ncbi:hypothetical protein EWM64_g9183 [Hericium alpestre]|uniref:Ketoreductase (KR) domain-containing protein n=1 Tax=Hericium alpestre TaxID=135208 RepID=A0A4Y9ZJE2_9AGAM|nr:hypothetical protein EWM64_g9183 [Hericium alpestre]
MSPTIHTQDADLPVTERFDVYPEIDPSKHIANKTYKDKVVLITGASRGIGKELAILYAKAGASLVLSARNQKLLEEVKQEVLRIDPAAKVVSVVADVADIKQTEAVVKAGVDRFGKLDVVIANAGKFIDWDAPIGEQNPIAWWSVFEVNLRGVHSLAQFVLSASGGQTQC